MRVYKKGGRYCLKLRPQCHLIQPLFITPHRIFPSLYISITGINWTARTCRIRSAGCEFLNMMIGLKKGIKGLNRFMEIKSTLFLYVIISNTTTVQSFNAYSVVNMKSYGAQVPNLTYHYNVKVKDCGFDSPREGTLQLISIYPHPLNLFTVKRSHLIYKLWSIKLMCHEIRLL